MNNKINSKKIFRSNFIKVLLLVGLYIISPSELLAQKCYTPEGSTVEQCAESENAEIVASMSTTSAAALANAAPCERDSFSYETLVKIPGLGKQNASGTNVVDICANSLGQYLQVGFNYFIGIAIALAVVMIIYGGVLYATTDAVSGKSEGKKVIQDAAYGLALALGSWLILYTINPDLLKFQLDIGKLKLQGSSQGGQGAELAALQTGSGGGILGVGSGDILSVARSEMAKGVRETSRNSGPEVNTYFNPGGTVGQPWCAYFATWVYGQAGYTSVWRSPSRGSSFGMRDWFRVNNNRIITDGSRTYKISFYSKQDIDAGRGTMQQGDMAFFDRAETGTPNGHVGIVTGAGQGTVTVINGNVSDRLSETTYRTNTSCGGRGENSVCAFLGVGRVVPQ
jgi:hypothetical protein